MDYLVSEVMLVGYLCLVNEIVYFIQYIGNFFQINIV